MSTIKNLYNGLCIGGPHAGEMMGQNHPQVEITTQIPISKSVYFFIPFMGGRGFWLHESETKGTGPFDDISRILIDSYVELHKKKGKVQ